MPFFRYPVFLIPLLLLAACAGPMTSAPQGSREEIMAEARNQTGMSYEYARRVSDNPVASQMRVSNIAFPILAANADFCGRNVAPSLGMTAWNIHSVNAPYRRTVHDLYGIGDTLSIQAVANNSPAARAGLKGGDEIVAINGQPVPSGPTATKAAASIVSSAGYSPIDIVVRRGGRDIRAQLTPMRVCNYPVILDVKSSEINAYTDGRKIVVSAGIVGFAENDNEVAMVIAHELGHVAMAHVNKHQQNAMIGMLGGLAVDSLLAAAGVGTGGQLGELGGQIAVQRYSVPFEQEADYVGMYFMERAGFDASKVAGFWRRMGATGESSVTRRTTHPTSPERYVAIERTYAEIAAKKAAKQPLIPNMREDH